MSCDIKLQENDGGEVASTSAVRITPLIKSQSFIVQESDSVEQNDTTEIETVHVDDMVPNKLKQSTKSAGLLLDRVHLPPSP